MNADSDAGSAPERGGQSGPGEQLGPAGGWIEPPVEDDGPDGTEHIAETIARRVLAHPAVVRLDAGRFGEITSLLPGRRVVGVRAGIPGAGAEVGVVLRLGPPIPDVVAQLRELVRGLTGPVPVDITVADLVDGPL
jgi:hypothetical protein